MQEFDLIVIGSGPAGYTGAIRASQLGMKVACIEMNKKDVIVKELCQGIESLFIKNKISKFNGIGKIINQNTVEVISDKNSEKITAKSILIATGSSTISLSGVDIDEKKIISSNMAISLKQVPKKLIVIGAGYIGLELGSVWHRLGSDVTVIEYADKIVPAMDHEISRNFQKILEKQGIKFMLSTKVDNAYSKGDQAKLSVTNLADNKAQNLSADVVLVAVGRKPYTDNLGLENIGVNPIHQA